jgi:hypothetical protein
MVPRMTTPDEDDDPVEVRPISEMPEEEKAEMREHLRAGRVKIPDGERELMEQLGITEDEVLALLAKAVGEQQ